MALLLILLLPSCAAKHPEVAPEQISIEEEQEPAVEKLDSFLVAYNLYKNNVYSNAKLIFESLAFDQEFPLQIYAAWYLGLIELKNENPYGVLKAVEQTFKYELGPLEPEILFLKGWAYTKLNLPQRAIEIYQTLEKSWPSKNAGLRKFRTAQALIALGENLKAASFLWEVELLHYGSVWSDNAKKLRVELEMKGIKTAPPQSLVERAFEIRTNYADWEPLYDLAKWYLDQCSGVGCDMARYYYARALEGKGEWSDAEKIYLDLSSGKTYGNLALWRLFSRAQGKDDQKRADELAGLLAKRYPNSELGSRAYVFIAGDYHANKKFDKELEYLRKSLDFKNVWRKDEVLWRAGWAYYRQNNLERAKINWELAINYAERADQRARLGFWLWKITGDEKYLDRIPKTNPPSYYQLLAQALKESRPYEMEIAESLNAQDFSNLTIDQAFNLLAGQSGCDRREIWDALFSLELNELLRSEFKWVERSFDDDIALFALAKIYRLIGAYNDAIRIAGRLFERGFVPTRELWELCFPMAYFDTVKSAAQRYGLDPIFVLSVMRQESAFDPTSTSSANAKGLMQIIPPTGEFLFERLKLGDFNPNLLYEPNLSVELGCYYLSSLINQFNSIVPALCAYNAGENRLLRWQPRFEGLSCYEAIEEIPFLETRTYVQRILRNWEIYAQLYKRRNDSIFAELLSQSCF